MNIKLFGSNNYTHDNQNQGNKPFIFELLLKRVADCDGSGEQTEIVGYIKLHFCCSCFEVISQNSAGRSWPNDKTTCVQKLFICKLMQPLG